MGLYQPTRREFFTGLTCGLTGLGMGLASADLLSLPKKQLPDQTRSELIKNKINAIESGLKQLKSDATLESVLLPESPTLLFVHLVTIRNKKNADQADFYATQVSVKDNCYLVSKYGDARKVFHSGYAKDIHMALASELTMFRAIRDRDLFVRAVITHFKKERNTEKVNEISGNLNNIYGDSIPTSNNFGGLSYFVSDPLIDLTPVLTKRQLDEIMSKHKSGLDSQDTETAEKATKAYTLDHDKLFFEAILETPDLPPVNILIAPNDHQPELVVDEINKQQSRHQIAVLRLTTGRVAKTIKGLPRD